MTSSNLIFRKDWWILPNLMPSMIQISTSLDPIRSGLVVVVVVVVGVVAGVVVIVVVVVVLVERRGEVYVRKFCLLRRIGSSYHRSTGDT